MQTTGDRVTAAAELSTGVQNSKNNLNCAYALGWVNIYGNSSAVVLNSDPALFSDGDVDGVTVTGQCLVY